LKTHGERRSRLFGFRISSIGKIAKDESGSASVEFVLLALPLFIPIFIFLNQFSSLSSQEMALQTLARESVRAFIESDSDRSGGALVNQVITLGGAKLGLKPGEISEIRSEIKCSTHPCHLPNGRVRITLRMNAIGNDGRIVQASAQQYFSPWSN
jgi:hypothetical protein